MPAADIATVHALRSDLALQIARCLNRRRLSQVEAARLLDVPQPTLSKIVNGRVTDLSLELLIRIAVRAGLPVVMQTGNVPEEAGAYVSHKDSNSAAPPSKSKLAESAQEDLVEVARKLTPEQRLNAMFEHTQLVSELHAVGRMAENPRTRKQRRTR